MTNITDEVKMQFDAVRNPKFKNLALFSCFLNGEPTAAIVAINKDGEEYIIKPLFVACTNGMVLTNHDGEEVKIGKWTK